MIVFDADKVVMKIDGHEVRGLTKIAYEREPEPQYGFNLHDLLPDLPTSISVDTEVPIEGLDAFVELLKPREPPGASPSILARRVKYGGRKGRRALRRLYQRTPSIEMTVGAFLLRGRMVMLDEQTIAVRGRVIGFR